MKRKAFLLAIAALLALGGFWVFRTRPSQRTDAFHNPNTSATAQTPAGPSGSGPSPEGSPRLAPPNPLRRFADFTPEQRVEFARKGRGPGG